MPDCTSCGRRVEGDFAFCPHCGAALEHAPPAAAREERRVVTVVFADLAGFTARAEQLDPEDVRALLAPYHAHLRTELERFGGTVEKFIGDAVMALFGAPVAHEDDPERAVRAALAIRDWAREQGDELSVRIAVNTGEALVALDARPSEGESMAAGDVVNSAARLQTAAPLNGVLVGERAHRATADVFEYRGAEPVKAKGKAEPIAAWEAVTARSRFGVDVTRRPTTPLVGRSRELDLLVSTLERVCEERVPQLVTLVGVPGIGKSRLVHELFKHVEQGPGLVRWRQGRSLPYGDGVTFWALAEIVKAETGALESDSTEQTEEKLRHAVGRVAADAASAQWLERQLRPLVGLPEDGTSASAGEASAGWRRFLELLAADRPLVCVFEDLHWADDALLEFVDGLVERTTGVPLLVLATARPELLQRRPGWGGGKPNALTASLSPLSDDETARLAAHLLDRKLLEAGSQTALLERAGGNPLYAEQFARVLNERGDLDSLPETVQGIIAARLDALSAEEKRLLQDAAVIGNVFWVGAVESVSGVARWELEELLHGLERKEFVSRSRTSSVGGESEIGFRHLLIRDVAYAQIPRSARVEKHRRVAAWIEAIGRPDDQAEMLAHHYVSALELAGAAGLDTADLTASARTALRNAGNRAASLYAVDAAREFYDAAVRLCPEDDPERPHLLLRRSVPSREIAVPAEDAELLSGVARSLLASGDRGAAANAEILAGRAYFFRGDAKRSREHTRRAKELVTGLPPSRETVNVLASVAFRAMLSGDSETARSLASRALDSAEELDWTEGLSSVLATLGSASVNLGDRGGVDLSEQSVELARRAGALGLLSRNLNGLAVVYIMLGDLRAASRARTEAATLAHRIGSAADVRWFEGVLAEDHYRQGRWDEALATADGFLADVDAGAPHYMAGQASIVRAEIRLARGDLPGALADVERALAQARAIDDPQVVHYLTAQAAHVFSIAEPERGLLLAHEFLATLAGDAELQFTVIALGSFAAAAHRLGLQDELGGALSGRGDRPWFEAARAYARGDLVAAAEKLDEIGSAPDEAEARLLAAEQLAATNPAEAAEQLRRALAFFGSVGAEGFSAEGEALRAASG